MSSINPIGNRDPQDPLYYAPRWIREQPEAPTSPAAENKPVRPVVAELVSPPRDPVETRRSRDAIFEAAVGEALRRPMEPEMVPHPPTSAFGRYRTIALWAIAISASALVATFFVVGNPFSKDRVALPAPDNQAPVYPLNSIAVPSAAPQRDVATDVNPAAQSRTPAAPSRAAQPDANPQSDAMLQRFMQWNQTSAPPAR
jgi:hypothetical protein